MAGHLEEERAQLLERSLRRVLDDPARRLEMQAAFERAFEVWLDRKWASLGKWSAAGIAAGVFAALMTLWAKSKGLI